VAKYLPGALAFQGIRLYNLIMSLSSNLFRLQQIDSQNDQIQNRLQEIETALSDRSQLKQIEHQGQEVEDRLRDSRKKLHQAEQAVKDQRIKIEQNESALYGGKVRIPKELQDLQNESASLKRYLEVLEDRQLEVMIEVDQIEAEQAENMSQLQQAQSQIATRDALLNGEKSNLLNELSRLEIERQAALPAVSSDDLALYDTLRKQKKGVAVARVSERACTACGATLTPAMGQAANSPSQISFCPSCGRILFSG
jgi:predicted  nucleic acid-binding Zn-ribbon protein